MRIGHGFDVHRLVPGRKLILGGVDVPYAMGLLGHSDADVLCHAVSDALLGALALGDIGRHFPDNDEQYKGASSIMLLGKVVELVREHSHHVVNIDATIIAQKPRLADYVTQMCANIASVVNVDTDRVSVKATTSEGLGFTGTGEGIAVHAVVLIEKTKG